MKLVSIIVAAGILSVGALEDPAHSSPIEETAIMTPQDANHIKALEEENRRLRAENFELREQIVNAHNIWRHEFATSVDAATDKLFKRLSGIEVLRNSVQQKEPQS